MASNLSTFTIDLEAKQNKLDRGLDEAEKKAKRSGDKMEKSLSLGGLAKTMLNVVAAAGAVEAGFRVAGAASAAFQGDTEAMEQSLRSIPGGVGAAIGAMMDLHDILDQQGEAARATIDAWNELGSTISDTATNERAASLIEDLEQKLAKLQGMDVGPDEMRVRKSTRAIQEQVDAVNGLTVELGKLVESSGGQAIALEKPNLENTLKALKNFEFGKALSGTVNLATPSLGEFDRLAQFEAVIDALREAGIEAKTSTGAFAALQDRFEELKSQSSELESALDELQDAQEKADTQERRRRIELLREENDFERRLMELKFEEQDQLAEASSDKTKKLIREEFDLRRQQAEQEQAERERQERERIERMQDARRARSERIEEFEDRQSQRDRFVEGRGIETAEFSRTVFQGGQMGNVQEVKDPEALNELNQVNTNLADILRYLIKQVATLQ